MKFNYSEKNPQNVAEANGILVTGTTGFLGCFILNDTLKNTKAEKVYCLVRATDEK